LHCLPRCTAVGGTAAPTAPSASQHLSQQHCLQTEASPLVGRRLFAAAAASVVVSFAGGLPPTCLIASRAPRVPRPPPYSRSLKNPALQLLQKSSKSASTTPQRPIWITSAILGVRDFLENGCTLLESPPVSCLTDASLSFSRYPCARHVTLFFSPLVWPPPLVLLCCPTPTCPPAPLRRDGRRV